MAARLPKSLVRILNKRQHVFIDKYVHPPPVDTTVKYVGIRLNGIGYRAMVQNNKVFMRLGFCHEEVKQIPEGIKVYEPPGEKKGEAQKLIIEGTSLHAITDFAGELKILRRPEPYKLTGVFVEGITRVKKREKKYPLKQKKAKR